MRSITVSGYQFRNFLLPAVAQSGAEKVEEWEVALRTIRKLKDAKLTAEVPLGPEEQKARDDGKAIYPERRLLEASAVFVFEEDEMNLVRDRVKKLQTRIALAAADDLQGLLDLLKDAPTVPVAVPD